MYIHSSMCIYLLLLPLSACIVENTDDFFKVTKVSKVLPGLGRVALMYKKVKNN